MNVSLPPNALGFVLALLALVLCVVFAAVGKLDLIPAGLIALVALSRLC